MVDEKPIRSKPRRRIRRLFLIAAVVLVCLIGGVVLLGPVIAGSLAPGIIGDIAGKSLAGKVTVGRASLSWFGKQAIAPVTIQDAQGREVAKLSIEISRGLFGLAKGGLGVGPMDLGRVSISGDATVIRAADGSTSIESLFRPASSAPSRPGPTGSSAKGIQLPAGLKGEVDISSLNILLKDEGSKRDIEIKGLAANAALANGAVSLSLKATATSREGTTAKPAGSIGVSATISNLADATGRLMPGAALADVTITATDLSTEIAGVLSGLGQKLVDGVGPTIRVSIAAKGGLAGGTGTVDVASAGVHANLKLASDNNTISLTSPATISVAGAAVAAFVPSRSLSDAGVSIDGFPGADVTIESLRVPIPAAGQSFDARSAAATIAVRTTPLRAVVATPDGQSRRIGLSAMTVALSAKDLASGVTIKAGADIAVDDSPSGSFALELNATGLVNASGAIISAIPTLAGQAALTDVSTVVVQGFVDRLGINVPSGVGPKLDIVATAAPAPAAGQTDIALNFRSTGLNGSFTAMVAGNSITAKGEASLKSPRSLAGKTLDGSGLDVSTGGFAKLVIREAAFDVARPVDSLRADVDASFGGFTVLPTGRKAAPIEINQIIVTAGLQPGQPAALRLKASGRHETKDWFGQGELSADLPKPGQKIETIRPVGSFRLSDLPTTLAALILDESKGLDRLIADAAGPSLTLTLSAAATQGMSRAITFEAASANVQAKLAADLEPDRIKLSAFRATSTVTPDIAARLVDRFAPGTTSAPRLEGPATITLEASAGAIPLKGLTPDLLSAGDAVVTIDLNGTVQPPPPPRSSDPSVKPVAADLRGLKLTANVPLSTLAQGGPPKPVQVTVRGGLFGESNTRIADFDGAATGNVAEGVLVGDVRAALNAEVRDARQLDVLLGKPGAVSGAVGDSAKLTAGADLDFENEPKTPGGSRSPAFKSVRAEVSIASPRVRQTRPFVLVSGGDRVVIESPTVLTWTPEAEWVNSRALSPQRGGAPQTEQTMHIAGKPEFSVRVSKLAFPLNAGTLFKPGVFEADVELASPAVVIVSGKSETAVKSIAIRTIGGKEPGVIGFSVRADDLGAGGGPGGVPALLFQGGVYNIADAEGKPTPDKALVTMTGDAYNAPSALLDSLANQGGMLAEVLGPMVGVAMRAQGASEKSGQLVITATSPRAELELKGSFAGGKFISEGEPRIVLHSMTPELGKMLLDGMPLIGTFEKKPEDGPATVRVQGLVVPLDGKLQKLNGEFTIDLGTARFASSGAFGTLLRLARQRDAGLVGRRLQPLSLSIKDGVLTYTRWKVPLGDFNFDTRGTVDLVNHRLDVITYIPFGALSDEAAGKLNSGIGRVIGGAIPLIEQATMVPFRTRGTFSESKTEADLELFVSEAGKTLLRPDRLIREGIEKLIKPEEKKAEEKPRPGGK